MPRSLIRKNPSDFKTLPLFVEATPEGLSYQAIGRPLNFAQTLQKRRPVKVADTQRFSLELANLGVSVRLTLNWQGRDYWVLVRQRRRSHRPSQRPERGRAEGAWLVRSAWAPPVARVWSLAGALRATCASP